MKLIIKSFVLNYYRWRMLKLPPHSGLFSLVAERLLPGRPVPGHGRVVGVLPLLLCLAGRVQRAAPHHQPPPQGHGPRSADTHTNTHTHILTHRGRFRHGRTGQPPGAASVGGRHEQLLGASRALLTIILVNWHIGARCGCSGRCSAQKLCEKGPSEP